MSGDSHAAELIQAVKSEDKEARFEGLGGAKMKLQQQKIEDWLSVAAVMGVWEVVKLYRYFKKRLTETATHILAAEFDAVILVDYPGFNLRLAQQLREKGYKGKIIYYISPQVWAWKKGRVKTMAKVLDLMLCLFPFEEEFYRQSGLSCQFVGHPIVDRIKNQKETFVREQDLIGLFPGSRRHEVMRLVPVFLDMIVEFEKQYGSKRWILSAANRQIESILNPMVQTFIKKFPCHLRVEVGNSFEWMQRVWGGVVASGTASLEAGCVKMPYVLVYKVNPLTYWIAKMVVKIKFIGIVNIIANQQVVTELVQGKCEPIQLKNELSHVIIDDHQRRLILEKLESLVSQLHGAEAASVSAAKAVVKKIKNLNDG